jgi:RNA polymerase sigma factor (sigma-70 family)
MTTASEGAEPSPKPAGVFATTHWSVVLAAGDPTSPQAAEALEKLCRTYWYPLYVYVRRHGNSPEGAQDLTQEFFVRILRSRSLSGANRQKGRFRSFLLGALKHFLADARDEARAKKRGGGQVMVSWEQHLAEERYAREPVEDASPDRLFERRWALTLLEQAAVRLQDEYEATGRAHAFAVLRGYVTGAAGPESSYADSAAALGLTESAVKSAIFRMRRRYHELVREEVAQTVAEPAQLEAEIHYLMALFSGSPATS